MDVENSSDVKDTINKYLINPTPSESFKRNRAYDANKNHLQTIDITELVIVPLRKICQDVETYGDGKDDSLEITCKPV